MEKIHIGDTYFKLQDDGTMTISRPDLIFFKNCQVTIHEHVTREVDQVKFPFENNSDHTPIVIKVKKIINKCDRP